MQIEKSLYARERHSDVGRQSNTHRPELQVIHERPPYARAGMTMALQGLAASGLVETRRASVEYANQSVAQRDAAANTDPHQAALFAGVRLSAARI